MLSLPPFPREVIYLDLEKIEVFAEKTAQKYGVDKDEIAKKLKVLIVEYKIPPQEATRAIISQIHRERGEEVKGVDAKMEELVNFTEGEYVNVEVRVAKVIPKEGKRPAAAVIGDETGMCRISTWSKEIPLERGKCYRIENAKVVEFGDRKQLQITADTEIEEIEKDVKLPDRTIEFTGVILDVTKNSGLVPTCPQCGRHAPKKKCPEHGKVKPRFAFKARIVIDDGEKCYYALFKDEVLEELAGFTVKEAKEMAKKEFDITVVRERVEESLFGKYVTVRGKPIGETLLVDSFEFVRYEEPGREETIEFVEEVIDFTTLVKENMESEDEEEPDYDKLTGEVA
jgi:replication factor A1